MNFIENQSAQKLRGGYYTPPDLALFLCRWVKETGAKRILEPSCGDGVFFSSLAAADCTDAEITAFELDAVEAKRARTRATESGLRGAIINSGDFLEWAMNGLRSGVGLFDAAVGNPPFVRYQYLPTAFQVLAEQIFRTLNLPFTKHTNAWVPFVLASLALLRPGGRLAMVVPAEIIHVTHAQPLRSYLGRECRRLVVIDPEEIWFSNTLQGAVILLAEKRSADTQETQGLGIYPVRGREFLRLKPSQVFDAPVPINGKTVEGKWTRALLDSETRSLIGEISAHQDVHRFDEIADVDVGIVTGANKFFLVTDAVVRAYKLQRWAHPMFGRSEHCPGVIYDAEQHASNAKSGNPTNFLWFRGEQSKITESAEAYIKFGESQRLPGRYKCRIRSPWYSVPSVYATDVGMLKRAHDTPRLILNTLRAYTTDTAYRIRSRVAPETLVGCFINPLTALSAEIEGRHYGGGVLELIPSEIERLLVPLLPDARIQLRKLDRSIRCEPTEQVLSRQGKIVLGGLGLSASKQVRVLEGWRKLRDRRHRNDVMSLRTPA